MAAHESPVPDYLPIDVPVFRRGDVVRHRRYGYRGLIVDFDLRCLADEDWYRSNRTQPDKEQAWYHVLVDGSEMVTYAAEEHLLPDEEAEAIDHPLVDRFFERVDGPPYVRNDEPWPSW